MTDSTPHFGSDDWQLLQRDTRYSGFFRVDSIRLEHKLYQGGWSDPIERELLMRQPAVAVLPYDPKLKRILLVEQFRIGATEDRFSPWCLELIAGIADVEGEARDNLVRREAKEEANLTLGELEPITSYLPSPGGCNERLHLFASACDLSQAGGIHGKPEEGENIRVMTYPMSDIPTLLAGDRVDNAATTIALQWFLLNQARLCHA